MKEKLVKIHNILMTVGVSGDNAINIAECLMELRDMVQNYDTYISEQDKIIEQDEIIEE